MAEDSTNTNEGVSGVGGSSDPSHFAIPPNDGAGKVQQPSPKPIPASDIEEAHIIEETVIKPRQKKQVASVPAPQATEPPPTPTSTNSVKSPSPVISSPTPPPKQEAIIPPPLTSSSVSSSSLSRPHFSDVGTAATPSQTLGSNPVSPPPASTPKITSPVIPQISENLGTEQERISKILEETKLPERRDPATSDQKPNGPTFDTTLGASIDAPEVELPKRTESALTATQQKEAPSSSSIVSAMRTLKNDLQDVVRDSKMSLVRAAALEQEKRHGQSTTDTVPSKRRASFMRKSIIVIVSLSVVGSGALLGLSFLTQKQTGNTPEIGSSILFVENTTLLPLEGNSALDIKRLIAGARLSGGGTLGSITRFVPIFADTLSSVEVPPRPVVLETFLNLMGAQAPEELVRALSEEFFFGIHTVDENAPLLVIPVLSYERAFAGMLAWEETINTDLAPAFTLVPTQVLGTSGLPEKRRFEDVVMRNYDVRALRDDNDEIQLYYSFPTRSILVIGESPYSFTEILNRLRSEGRL